VKTRAAFVALLLISLPLVGQTFISAKAGLVNYEEGVRAASPRQLQEGEVFSTPNRSELLMMPGAYLRLERSAEIRMLSTSVSHPVVELLGGLASVEVNEMPKESTLALQWSDYKDAEAISIVHKGLYRFEVSQDASSLTVMVQTGRLQVGGSSLKDGEELVLNAGHASSVSHFNRKLHDDFDIWAANRDQLASVASYRTASSVGNSYFPSFGVWAFNPMLGFFSYLPYDMMTSPWGYYYYAPRFVYYYPYPNYGYGYGYGYGNGYGNGNSGGGTGGGMPVRAVIGSTPGQHAPGRFPVYANNNSGGSNSFSGSSPRTSVGFGNSNNNSGYSSGSGASSSTSSGSFGGAARSSVPFSGSSTSSSPSSVSSGAGQSAGAVVRH
jgi:hypothetical protein